MSDDSTPDLPATPDLSSALGGLDFSSLLDMAGQMQQQMAQAQEEAASTVVEGSAGGGAVKIEATGSGEFRSVTISPDAVQDLELLQDLVLAAVRDAMTQVQAIQSQGMGGLGDAVAGLGDLGDLFGG